MKIIEIGINGATDDFNRPPNATPHRWPPPSQKTLGHQTIRCVIYTLYFLLVVGSLRRRAALFDPTKFLHYGIRACGLVVKI